MSESYQCIQYKEYQRIALEISRNDNVPWTSRLAADLIRSQIQRQYYKNCVSEYKK